MKHYLLSNQGQFLNTELGKGDSIREGGPKLNGIDKSVAKAQVLARMTCPYKYLCSSHTPN